MDILDQVRGQRIGQKYFTSANENFVDPNQTNIYKKDSQNSFQFAQDRSRFSGKSEIRNYL